MKHILDKYKTILTEKQFLKMIVANVINRFGDSIDAIAFTWLVYQITHDAAWSAIIFGVNMIPTIILQPLAGPIVERLHKKGIMVWCDIARGIMVASIAICFLAGILNPWLLLLITFLNSSFEALRVPAGIAFVPKLLKKECYNVGAALNGSLSRVMELIGTGCAGFIIAIFGIHTAILIDAVTFFLSAIIIFFIHYDEEVSKEKISFASYKRTMKEGIQYVTKRQAIIMLCILGALLNVLAVPINSLFPAFIGEVLQGDSQMLSYLSLSLTLGMMFGSIVYPIIADKLSRRITMLGTMILSGIVYILVVFIPQFFGQPMMSGLMVMLFLWFGIVMAVANTSLSVYFMIVVKEEYMARVGSVFNASVTAVVPIFSFLISGVVSMVPLSTVFLLSGILSMIVGIICLSLKSMHVLDMDTPDENMSESVI